MDQHLKFRMDSMKQASSPLGRPPARFRVNTTPMLFRSKCKPEPLPESGAQTGTPGTSTLGQPAAQASLGAKDSPQVQKQVKQLQFWLKVFSRFCQDETTCD